MSSTLNFGKHRGKSIEEVFESDVGYCRWLLNQKQLFDADSDIGKFLAEKFSNDDGSFLMTWGRHKNKTIKQINVADPKYIEWLRKNDYVNEKIPKLKAALDEL